MTKGLASIDNKDNDLPNTRNVLDKILEYTMEGIAIIGDDKRIEFVNDRVCEIIGRPRDEILGQAFLRFIHPDSSDLVEKRYASRLSRETIPQAFEIKILHDNDGPRNIQVRTSILTNGENKIKILAQLLDVTDEHRTLNTLSEYVMKYSTLVETMNEGLSVIDDKGNLVHANAAMCEMLDYTEKALVGKTTADVMYGFTLDAVFDKIKERIAGRPSRYETSLIHRSGRLIPTMVSASPLINEEGEYKGSFAIFTDLTAQKKLKKDLQTARNRALLYLDLMSHDIRNNLQEIQISTELLKSRIDDSSSHDNIEHILHAVSRSSSLISETNIIAELAELSLCERLLDETLNETVMAAIMHFDDVEFNMSIQVSNARIRADDYLELLLSDLLSNACEHCQKDEKRVWITLAEGGDTFELVISHNGQGMSIDAKDSVFDTSRRSGGLRLQLARLIVEKYTGTIEVLDRVDGDLSQGSKIKVLFPRLV